MVLLTSIDKLANMRTLIRARTFGILIVVLLAFAILLTSSAASVLDRKDQVQRFTRQLEFDYLGWTTRALGNKLSQFGLGASGFLTDEDRNQAVLDYLDLVREAGRLSQELTSTLSDPNLPNPELTAKPISDELQSVREQLEDLKPLAETVLQENVAVVLDDNGLGVGGTAFPPVAFQFSELPVALIVSPTRCHPAGCQSTSRSGLEPGRSDRFRA